MSLIAIPTEPLPIVWQNTIVDIEATSRYPKEGAPMPDMASINTTICLVNPQDTAKDVTFLAPGHHEAEASIRELGELSGVKASEQVEGSDQFNGLVDILQTQQQQTAELLEKIKKVQELHLEVLPGRRILRFFTRLPVIQEADGTYKFSELVPRQFAKLEGRADFSIVVFLPRASEGYANIPAYQVNIERFTSDPAPQVFDQSNVIGQRKAVAWYWRQDPILEVVYRYA